MMNPTLHPTADPSFEGTPDDRLAAIESIVTDEALPVGERQARLEALAAEWNLPPDPAVEDAAADPVRVQIARALALLAEGGHKVAP